MEAASPPPNPAGKLGCQDPRTPSLLTPCHTNYCTAVHTSMAQRRVCCFASAGILHCTAHAEQPGDTQGAEGSAQGHRHGAQSQHSQQGWWHQKSNGQKWGNGDLQLQSILHSGTCFAARLQQVILMIAFLSVALVSMGRQHPAEVGEDTQDPPAQME